MIAMWMLADMIGMECKWLLLIPIEHSAYVGLIADAYTREQGTYGSDLSTCEAVTTILFYLCVFQYFSYQTVFIQYALFTVLLVKIILRFSEYLSIYSLYFKHKFVLAFLSLIPGVGILCALRARRG